MNKKLLFASVICGVMLMGLASGFVLHEILFFQQQTQTDDFMWGNYHHAIREGGEVENWWELHLTVEGVEYDVLAREEGISCTQVR